MKGLHFFLLPLFLGLLVAISSADEVKETGHYVQITYDTLEEAKSAIEEFDRPGSHFLVTGAFNTTIKLYTTSQDHLRSLKKRSQMIQIRVRLHGGSKRGLD
jgi:hypothetical protein